MKNGFCKGLLVWLVAMAVSAGYALAAGVMFIEPTYEPSWIMASYHGFSADEYMAAVQEKDCSLGRVLNEAGSMNGMIIGEMAQFYLDVYNAAWDETSLAYTLMHEGYEMCGIDDPQFMAIYNQMQDYALWLMGTDIYAWGKSPYGSLIQDEYYLFGGEKDGIRCTFMFRVFGEYDGGEGIEFKWSGGDPAYAGSDETESSGYGTYLGSMYVVNCRKWVSLRAEMSSASKRLAKVPLGAQVSDVYLCSDTFAWCMYNGMEGFIQLKYLGEDPPAVEPGFFYGFDASSSRQDIKDSGNAVNASAYGSVEQDFGHSAFWNIYPDYVPFDGPYYASTTYTQGWCEGDYIFSAGCEYRRVVNCDSYVSLRAEANADTAAIAHVQRGETVLANGELNGWVLCKYNNRYGWIRSSYLERC